MTHRDRRAWGATGLFLAVTLALGTCAFGPQGTGGTARATLPPGKGEAVAIILACMDYQRAEFEGLARDFETANPDIHIQFVSASEAAGMQQQGNTVSSDGNEHQRLAAAADTFLWYASLRPADWAYLLDMGPFVNDPAFPKGDFYPGTLDDLSWQGSVYGLPASLSPFLVYYDKKAFDAAGVPYPRIGWTWGRSGAKVCPTGQCRIVHLADTLQPRVWYNAEAQSAVLMYNG